MPTNDVQFCTECGKATAADNLFLLEGRSVCPECKPAFAQRLRQEGIAPVNQRGLQYAGFWIRLAARFMDSVIIGVAALALNVLLGFIFRAGDATSTQGMAPLVGLLIFASNIALAAFYEAFFLVRNAATPGKMALSLRVINANGAPITWGKALGRFFCYYLDTLTLTIGYLIAAFDSEKRALHDHICGTRVIRQDATQRLLTQQ